MIIFNRSLSWVRLGWCSRPTTEDDILQTTCTTRTIGLYPVYVQQLGSSPTKSKKKKKKTSFSTRVVGFPSLHKVHRHKDGIWCLSVIQRWCLIMVCLKVTNSNEVLPTCAILYIILVGASLVSHLSEQTEKRNGASALGRRVFLPRQGKIAGGGFVAKRGTVKENRASKSSSFAKTFNLVMHTAFEKWNLKLFVRMTSSKWTEARTYLMPTLKMFWPQSYLLIVLDGEKRSDRDFAKNVTSACREYSPVTVEAVTVMPRTYPGLEQLQNARGKHFTGYYRAQLDLLYADENVDSKYVGILDTDAVFTTMVTPESIFTNGTKPKVIGFAARAKNHLVSEEAFAVTTLALKRPFQFGCMSMWPVVVHTKHLSALRKHMEKLHNVSFVRAYTKVWSQRRFICHFTILCNYLWQFHRDDYDFHFQNPRMWLPGWENNTTPEETTDFSFLNEENKILIARVSIHGAHADSFRHFNRSRIPLSTPRILGHLGYYEPFLVTPVMIRGFCFAAIAPCLDRKNCPDLAGACEKFGFKREPNLLLFDFEADIRYFSDTRSQILAEKVYTQSLMGHARVNWLPYAADILDKKLNSTQWTQLALKSIGP